GTAYDYNDGIWGLVSYRTSPFTIDGNQKNMVGGLRYSAVDTKNANSTAYIKGSSKEQCDSNGIYFLTDGAPNSTTYGPPNTNNQNMTQTIMNYSLTGDYKFNGIPTSTEGNSILVSP